MSEEASIPSQGGPAPDDLLNHVFPTARRGLDPDAVRRYLVEIADALRAARRREAELREQLAAREQQTGEPTPLDAAALSAAVGQETARVLQVAHEAADEVLARARTEAEALRASASTFVEDAERRAEQAAASITEKATAEAERLRQSTREDCREMVEVARAARQRILSDLTVRRRELHVQIEQLRAGKDALADVVDAVASYIVHAVEEVKEQLAGAEDGARLAAEEVAAAPGAFVAEVSEQALLAEAESLKEPEGGFPELDMTSDGAPAVPLKSETPAVASEADAVVHEAGEAAYGEDGATAEGNAIDELFAKIRQSRAEEVEHAQKVLEQHAAAAGEAQAAAAHDREVVEVLAAEAADAAEVADADNEPSPEVEEAASPEMVEIAAETAAKATEAVAGEAPPEDEVGEELDEGATEAFVARDELLAPSTTELARVLKRQLRMEQNQLLDAFRNLRKGGDPVALLPGAEMATRLEGDVADALTAAFAAGRSFAARAVGVEPSVLRQPVSALAPVTAALSASIVDPIRRRVEEGLASESEEAPLAIGAAFREWKGPGADETAADFALQAFSAGVLDQAAASGREVSWIVDDGEQRCPDCDDNAIAGAQAPGASFPTGHAHPPIHPGCRCLLVVAPR